MTTRIRRTVLGLSCTAFALLLALGLGALRHVGEARADAPITALTTDGAGMRSTATLATPPNGVSLPSSVAAPSTEAPSSPAPTMVPTATADDLDTSDVARLWRSGSFIGAGAVAVFLLLTFLVKVDSKRAFYWASGLTAIGLIIDAVVAGATPTAGMLIVAASTLVALLVRGPLAAHLPPASRAPERGAAAFALLAVLASIAIAVGAVTSAGCAATKREVRDVADDIVDCTAANAQQLTAQFGPLIDSLLRAATQPDGRIDWVPIKAATKGFAWDTGACVLAEIVARALRPPVEDPTAPKISPLVADPAELRSGFDELRRELWDGRRFRTKHGVL